jgi:hypothetical protein
MFRKIFILYITTFIFTIILASASYAQTPITGGTTWGTEIVAISPDTNISKISDLLNGTGLDKISCKFITLDGINNQLKIDVPYLSSEFDLDTGGSELKTGFKVLSLFISSSGGEEDNWIGVEGSLGGHAIRFELSFKPGFKAVTCSAVQDPNNIEDTTFRIRLFNKDNNTFKTLFEKSTTEWEKTGKDETEITKIKNVIDGLNQALSNKDWNKLRSYCVHGSMAYNGINKKEQKYRDCYNSPNCVVQDRNIVDNINPINISGQYAEAYVFVTTVWILADKVEKHSSEGWYCLKKIGNDWKLYGYSK